LSEGFLIKLLWTRFIFFPGHELSAGIVQGRELTSSNDAIGLFRSDCLFLDVLSPLGRLILFSFSHSVFHFVLDPSLDGELGVGF